MIWYALEKSWLKQRFSFWQMASFSGGNEKNMRHIWQPNWAKLEAQDQLVTFTIFSLKLPGEPAVDETAPGVWFTAAGGAWFLVGVGRYPTNPPTQNSTQKNCEAQKIQVQIDCFNICVYIYIYLICICANYCKFQNLELMASFWRGDSLN